MPVQEPYTHNRNYGCRIRQYTYENVAMLSMENQLVKVVFSVGKGADIVEFVYKPKDVDFMWHSFQGFENLSHLPTTSPSAGNFLDTYTGGWQELFPTYGGNTNYHGGEIGIHGEACIYPWNVEILQDTVECIQVRMWLRTVRSPFLLERIITLRGQDPKMSMQQRITNLSSVEQDFMWGHHPAFGVPFLDDSVQLHLKGQPDVLVPASTIAHRCPFDHETAGKWPMLPDQSGQMRDMSRACAPDDKVYMEYLISNLEEGAFELVNHNLELGMRMTWDPKVFKYLWVWGLYCGIEQYPWYGRSYVMAVEPWSSFPADYQSAAQKGELLSLAAGGTMETAVCAEPFCVNSK